MCAFVPESPIKTPTRLDLPGALLLSLMLAAPSSWRLSEGQHWGWGSARTVGLLVFAAVALRGVDPARAARGPSRSSTCACSRGRVVALANATGFFAGFALFSAFVLVPRFVETPRSIGLDYGFGLSATQAGLVPAAREPCSA